MRSSLDLAALALLLGARGEEPTPVLPSTPPPSSSPAASVAPVPSARGECTIDSDCVLVAHAPDTEKPCCTCDLRAVTRAEADHATKQCAAPAPPNAPLRDTICILSCLRTPGIAARCVDGACAAR